MRSRPFSRARATAPAPGRQGPWRAAAAPRTMLSMRLALGPTQEMAAREARLLKPANALAVGRPGTDRGDPPVAALLVRVSRHKLLRVSRHKLLRVRPGRYGLQLVAPLDVPLEHLGRILVERLNVGPGVLGVAGEAHVFPGSARVLLGPT